MTRSLANRCTTGLASAAPAVGAAAPTAAARPIAENEAGPFFRAEQVQLPAPTAAAHATGDGTSDWGYLAIGSVIAFSRVDQHRRSERGEPSPKAHRMRRRLAR